MRTCVGETTVGVAAAGRLCGQWTVSVFHGGLESFVCVCLIALLPQAGHRKQWVRRGATECSKGNEQGLK